MNMCEAFPNLVLVSNSGKEFDEKILTKEQKNIKNAKQYGSDAGKRLRKIFKMK